MHQLSGEWSDLPCDALSWLADKLIAFDDQIEEYWEVIMDDENFAKAYPTFREEELKDYLLLPFPNLKSTRDCAICRVFRIHQHLTRKN